MKKSSVLILGLFVLLTQACSKKGNSNGVSGNGAGIVISAAAACGNDSYQSQSWDRYSSYGFKTYRNDRYDSRNNNNYDSRDRRGRSSRRYSAVFDNIGYVQGAGFCGCAMGSVPACDSEGGISCIRQTNVVNANLVRMQFDPGSANFVTAGAGPISYTTQSGNFVCYDSVAVTCRLDSSDGCALTGGTCRPTSRRSVYGVCVY